MASQNQAGVLSRRHRRRTVTIRTITQQRSKHHGGDGSTHLHGVTRVALA